MAFLAISNHNIGKYLKPDYSQSFGYKNNVKKSEDPHINSYWDLNYLLVLINITYTLVRVE